MKKVAIITRTKDRPVFLKRAIESIAGQTYKDYVHVIVNDGGELKVLESVVDSFDESIRNNIKIFNRNEPSGAPDTIFNESIDRVDSNYVVIHDDDDTWHPKFLEETVPLLDSGAHGVLARTDKVYENLNNDKIKKIKSERYMADVVSVSLYRQCIDNQLTPISFIFSRDAYKKVGKFDQSLPVAGDWEFGIRFLKSYDVEFVDPGYSLAFYHHRKNVKDSSYANINHRQIFTKVANQYLRRDLDSNTLGLGYIMNKLKHDMDVRHGLIKKIVPKKIINRLR